jgi:branched-chain amino acid transport system substrate-binding protein
MGDRVRVRATLRGAIAVALACCATAGCRQAEPIRLGLVAGLTGRHYGLGVSCRSGAELAVHEINAAGGIRGRRVELLVRDDAQDPDVARRAVRELIGDGVVAIVGHATSAMAEATLPIADEEHVLMVSPTVSSPMFSGRDDWLVMLDAAAATAAEAMAVHVLKGRPGLRVSIVYDLSNRAYSEPWRENFGRSLRQKGGHVAREVSFVSGKVVSFGALVEDALLSDPDAVLLVANALDTAMLAQHLHRRSPRVQLLGTGWGSTTDVLEHGGAALEGTLFPLRVNPQDSSPSAERFRTAFGERYGHAPDFAAIQAYEAVQVLGLALARDPTREGVRREVLRLGTVHGVTDDFQIDRFGDAQRRTHISTVRDGRFLPLE